jgi:hypothetical protein
MSLSHFAYCVLGDSEADADMVYFEVEPQIVPGQWFPFGQPVKATDGQTFYSGPPSIAFIWGAMPFDTNINGTTRTAGNGGTIKKFYEDWHRAETDGQRFVVWYYNPLTDGYVKDKVVIPWPDWSGKENGEVWQGWTLILQGIGVDFDTAPAWGEPNPVAYSEDSVTLGDELVGTPGWGVPGWGLPGHGSNDAP